MFTFKIIYYITKSPINAFVTMFVLFNLKIEGTFKIFI